jgi:hypothetical protein
MTEPWWQKIEVRIMPIKPHLYHPHHYKINIHKLTPRQPGRLLGIRYDTNDSINRRFSDAGEKSRWL